MPVTCPAGHASESTDYCDTCGAAIEGSLAAPGPTASPSGDPAAGTGAPPAGAAPGGTAQIPAVGSQAPCPNCGAPARPDDAFCEVCGIDFATGELPAKPAAGSGPTTSAGQTGATPTEAGATTGAPAAAPSGEAPTEQWVVVIETDRDFYEGNQNADVPVAFPEGLAPREVPLMSDEVLIGRRSDTKGIFPDVDLGAPTEDPGVSRRHAVLRRRPDGSWVVIDQGSTNGTRVGGVRTPIVAGEERLLLNGDYLLVGAWTRITLKRGAATA